MPPGNPDRSDTPRRCRREAPTVTAYGRRYRASLVNLEDTMLKVIAVLLVVWLVVAVLGAVIEGLFWLTVVGALLFLATAGYGYLRRRSGSRQAR